MKHNSECRAKPGSRSRSELCESNIRNFRELRGAVRGNMGDGDSTHDTDSTDDTDFTDGAERAEGPRARNCLGLGDRSVLGVGLDGEVVVDAVEVEVVGVGFVQVYVVNVDIFVGVIACRFLGGRFCRFGAC